MKAPEARSISAAHAKGLYTTKLYEGARKHGLRSDFDEVVILAPGWLGTGTLHFAARALARKGHDVAVVSHPNTSLFHPNKDRSKDVHFAARAASQATGKKGVILIGHSNGNQDIHHAAAEGLRRQQERPEDKSLYRINAIGAMAGAGLSGHRVNLAQLHLEAVGVAKEFVGHPIEEIDVVARSVANFCRHPGLALVEGFGAYCCDVRPEAGKVLNGSDLRSYKELYLDKDKVIKQPEGRADFAVEPGSHLTAIITSEPVTRMAESLYEDNAPTSLQLARLAA